jgi:tRNA pseudouridine32 synthase / 23S rRNA pseudouridine746 synthase
MKKSCFTYFKSPIDHIELPDRFTFPFYYEPHSLSVFAAAELQEYLKTQNEWTHNFGIDKNQPGMVIGKMFGVLVVQNQTGEIGYLSAFSGKLADSNHHQKFVPPVFDMLTEDSFFNVGIVRLNEINHQIKELEQSVDYVEVQKKREADKLLAATEIQDLKQAVRTEKTIRKAKRAEAQKRLSAEAYQELNEQLNLESQLSNIKFKKLTDTWKIRLQENEQALLQYTEPIHELKLERKTKSAALQQQLFHQYQFLNQYGERKNLLEIFTEQTPTAGSGECAAPKLLQYAFLNHLKPIAMAEFWWGESPKSEVRIHKNFYPACYGKCKPILSHMLKGIETDENPMLINSALGQTLTTVYEDEPIVVINKPPEFLSVPGKNVQDSVLHRMQVKYPGATGPMVVHRLDMSTSGLMLVAKTLEAYQYLQYQFIKRKIKKRYTALLDGIIEADKGSIDLPLRVDLDDRPRQLVCTEHGKKAQTEWEVIHRSSTQTRVHFFPITGRTHQLRVHAAHPLGLNTPIIGDDLYGKKGDRLYLHAAAIEFKHPTTREMMRIEVEADF